MFNRFHCLISNWHFFHSTFVITNAIKYVSKTSFVSSLQPMSHRFIAYIITRCNSQFYLGDAASPWLVLVKSYICCFWYIQELLLLIFFHFGVAFFSNPRPHKNLEQWTVKKILWVSFIYTTSPKVSYLLDIKI